MNEQEIDAIELDLLLQGILRRYGYDFGGYARASLKRRVTHTMKMADIDTITELISRVLRDEAFFSSFLKTMSVTVTDMFRDPLFYGLVRKEVVPFLKTFPFFKVWHAGCATGEEVYSMAIVLKEEGLDGRGRLYATDFNDHALDTARKGIYSLERTRQFLTNYNQSEPRGSFSDYYHAKYSSARIADSLRGNITFANHNLVHDAAFGEMQLIVCRNVLIYFNKDLQNRVLTLFLESLCQRGFLCLGSKETLGSNGVAEHFETISKKDRIFRKR